MFLGVRFCSAAFIEWLIKTWARDYLGSYFHKHRWKFFCCLQDTCLWDFHAFFCKTVQNHILHALQSHNWGRRRSRFWTHLVLVRPQATVTPRFDITWHIFAGVLGQNATKCEDDCSSMFRSFTVSTWLGTHCRLELQEWMYINS